MDTIFTLWERCFPVDGYAKNIKEAFDVIYRDAADSGWLLTLNLHPWLIGQPHRIGFLDSALAHITAPPASGPRPAER